MQSEGSYESRLAAQREAHTKESLAFRESGWLLESSVNVPSPDANDTITRAGMRNQNPDKSPAEGPTVWFKRGNVALPEGAGSSRQVFNWSTEKRGWFAISSQEDAGQ